MAAHLVSPKMSKTIKILHASMSNRWIITDIAWLGESYKKGEWIDEVKYGFKNMASSPFAGKKYYVAESFHAESRKSARKAMYMDYVRKLVVEVGGGVIVDEENDADVVFAAVKDKKGRGGGEGYMTWNEFINCIPLGVAK